MCGIDRPAYRNLILGRDTANIWFDHLLYSVVLLTITTASNLG